MNAGSFHERVDAFESSFERKYLSFQLHCRGVQALRQARRRLALPGRPPSNASHASHEPASAESAGEVDTSRSDTTVVDAPDPDEQAETYLLETKGAELAEIVTARECQKLVRRHSARAMIR